MFLFMRIWRVVYFVIIIISVKESITHFDDDLTEKREGKWGKIIFCLYLISSSIKNAAKFIRKKLNYYNEHPRDVNEKRKTTTKIKNLWISNSNAQLQFVSPRDFIQFLLSASLNHLNLWYTSNKDAFPLIIATIYNLYYTTVKDFIYIYFPFAHISSEAVQRKCLKWNQIKEHITKPISTISRKKIAYIFRLFHNFWYANEKKRCHNLNLLRYSTSRDTEIHANREHRKRRRSRGISHGIHLSFSFPYSHQSERWLDQFFLLCERCISPSPMSR